MATRITITNTAAPGIPQSPEPANTAKPSAEVAAPREVGGPSGPEPTRFGDWERRGRCIDF
ncbi:MAG: DUF1674 domain-containing protein [Gammaproteobacteria bacterium]